MELRSSLSRVARLLATADRPALAFALQAWALAPVAEAALRTVGVRRTLRAVAAIPPRSRSGSAVGVADGAGWVARAFRLHLLLPGLCLPRAVVQLALHRRDGVPARLVIGVRREGDADHPLHAHAWVEPIGVGAAPAEAERFASILVSEGAA
jgi:hypothetical protein